MRWNTHVVAGLCTTAFLLPFTPWLKDWDVGLWCISSIFGSLLPDLDAAESKIKHLKFGEIKPFHSVSQIIFKNLGHRGVLHSLLGWLVVSVISLPIAICLGWEWQLGLILGYGCHLVADACTIYGIAWCYPRKVKYHLLRRKWRVSTGSQAEDVVFVIFALIGISLLLKAWLSQRGTGPL